MSEATEFVQAQRLSVMEQKAAQADAKSEAAALTAAIKAQYQDDVLNVETKAEVKALNLGMNPVKATNNANLMVPLYHAFDGRTVPVPMYQVAKRFTVRFTAGDDCPAEYVGQRVWYPNPQRVSTGVRAFKCPLQVGGETRPDILAAGLQPSCRHKAGFFTEFDAEEHFRKRHPKRWAAHQRFITQNTTKESNDKLSQAIALMAQALTQKAEQPKQLYDQTGTAADKPFDIERTASGQEV